MRSANSAIPQTSRLETEVEKDLDRPNARNFRFGTFIMTVLYLAAWLAEDGENEVGKFSLADVFYFSCRAPQELVGL